MPEQHYIQVVEFGAILLSGGERVPWPKEDR